jgi:hypothetical protein
MTLEQRRRREEEKHEVGTFTKKLGKSAPMSAAACREWLNVLP